MASRPNQKKAAGTRENELARRVREWTGRTAREIAEAEGRPEASVRSFAWGHGIVLGQITRKPRDVKWSAVDWNRPTRGIAAELGISRQAVDQARTRFGITRRPGGRAPGREPLTTEVPSPGRTGRKPREWPQSVFDKLGKVSDYTIAREAGVCLQTIMRLRKRHGISAANPSRTLPGGVPALILRRLGTASDRSLALEARVDVSLIRRARQVRGIPVWRHKSSIPAQVRQLLGKAPDRELAERFGISPSRVWRDRKRLGIPAFDARGKNPMIRTRIEAMRARRRGEHRTLDPKQEKKPEACST